MPPAARPVAVAPTDNALAAEPEAGSLEAAGGAFRVAALSADQGMVLERFPEVGIRTEPAPNIQPVQAFVEIVPAEDRMISLDPGPIAEVGAGDTHEVDPGDDFRGEDAVETEREGTGAAPPSIERDLDAAAPSGFLFGDLPVPTRTARAQEEDSLAAIAPPTAALEPSSPAPEPETGERQPHPVSDQRSAQTSPDGADREATEEQCGQIVDELGPEAALPAGHEPTERPIGLPKGQDIDSLPPGSASSAVATVDADLELELAPEPRSQDAAGDDASDGVMRAPPRPPTRYKPKLRERPQRGAPLAERAVPPAPNSADASGTLEADLLLAIQPGGWGISLSLLLRRSEALPERVAIQHGGEVLTLSAIDDALYEPAPIEEPGTALFYGIAAETVGPLHRRWVRTGRQLHAFSERAGVPGFASIPRVLIGQENVVLCEESIADRVLECCGAAGSGPPEEVLGPGIPGGWRCFRGFRPIHPAERGQGEEIFLALSPLPHAAIEFSGGVAISRGVWLAIRPPTIRILGGIPDAGAVTIDAEYATSDGDGWTARGWDRPGLHVVRYAGISRRYEIAEAEPRWPSWPAHCGSAFSVVGALAADARGAPAVVLQGPACWLLGAQPGDVAWAAALPGGFAASAAPSFAPVWAIVPKAGRRRATPRLLDTVAGPRLAARGIPRERLLRWCELIRDCGRTPVAFGGADETSALWQRYLAAARYLRKSVR